MSSVPSLMPEEEGIPNTRGSCTVDEAVARLLGWFKSPISRRFIKVSEHGVSIDQMPFLVTFYDSLDQTLYELRESARVGLLDAAEAKGSDDLLQARESAVLEMDRLIVLARHYRLAIEDAAFRPDSPFVVNHDMTSKTGVSHFTLVSLDAWTKEKFNKSLFDGPTALPEELTVGGESANAPSAGDSASKSVSEEGRSYQSLLVTFALLVDRLAETAPKFKRGEGPNASSIATELASAAAKKSRSRGHGQKADMIRQRISVAKNALRDWVDSA